jgi:hypothetical protein
MAVKQKLRLAKQGCCAGKQAGGVAKRLHACLALLAFGVFATLASLLALFFASLLACEASKEAMPCFYRLRRFATLALLRMAVKQSKACSEAKRRRR